MIKPNLGGIDLMPVARFPLLQQEIDASAAGAPFGIILPSLAIPTAFGMTNKLEMVNVEATMV